MQEMMKALCRIWKPAWQGFVMGEMTYKKGNGFPGAVTSSVREGRLVRVVVRDEKSGEEMGLVLLPPGKGKQEKVMEGKPWHRFSAGEVHAFSRKLGDHNEIHQGTHPVVSGFQLAAALQEDFPCSRFSLRFRAPVYAGEEVKLSKKGGRLFGVTDRLCFVREEK